LLVNALVGYGLPANLPAIIAGSQWFSLHLIGHKKTRQALRLAGFWISVNFTEF